MKIIVIGDIHVDIDFFYNQVQKLPFKEEAKIIKVEWLHKNKADFQHDAHTIEMNGPDSVKIPSILEEEVEDTDIIFTHFCPIPTSLIRKAKKLKLIGTCRGGLEHIAVDEAKNRGILVINTIRNAEPVADFTIGLIIAETRNIARAHYLIKKGMWSKNFPNSSYTSNLVDKKVGIIGFGNIGQLVAKKLLALGIEPLVNDLKKKKENILEINPNVIPVSLEQLLTNSDIITIHARCKKGMKPLIDRAAFDKMKPNCTLINTSRAYAVDEEALIEALISKKIAGAAIDVFSKEPIPLNHPLLHLDNVTLTPHIAGDTVSAIPLSPKLLIQKVINHPDCKKIINI